MYENVLLSRPGRAGVKEGCQMAQSTPHYGLHQWEPEDSFLREDFNQDLARIDTALAKKTELVMGSYTGDGGT